MNQGAFRDKTIADKLINNPNELTTAEDCN